MKSRSRARGSAAARLACVAILAGAVGCADDRGATVEAPRAATIELVDIRPGCVRRALPELLLAQRYTIRNATDSEVVAGKRASDSRRGPPVIGGRLLGPSEDRLIFAIAAMPDRNLVRLAVTGAYVANLGTLFERVVSTPRPGIEPAELESLKRSLERDCAGG